MCAEKNERDWDAEFAKLRISVNVPLHTPNPTTKPLSTATKRAVVLASEEYRRRLEAGEIVEKVGGAPFCGKHLADLSPERLV